MRASLEGERVRKPAPAPRRAGALVPFDTPSSVMFKGTRVIVANQSFFTGDSANQAIPDVEAGERGMPEFIPRRAGRPATARPDS